MKISVVIFLIASAMSLLTGYNPPATSGMLFACTAVILVAIAKAKVKA